MIYPPEIRLLIFIMCMPVFCSGYWTLFITIAAELFGSDLRATVAITVPNFVRGSIIPLTMLFAMAKNYIKYAWRMSHTCRRSFCTNEFLDGTPTNLIMAISGHKTEKAFRRYIKADQVQKAHMIKKLWDKRPGL
jgi:hypothetical protein